MKLSFYSIIGLCSLPLLTACSTTQHKREIKPSNTTEMVTDYQSGIASFYSDKFNGRRTASGERFNNKRLTAAHRTLPFGAQVRVTALWNNKSVVVRINDRGPFIKGRVIDISKAAAAQIGLVNKGIGKVKVEVLR